MNATVQHRWKHVILLPLAHQNHVEDAMEHAGLDLLSAIPRSSLDVVRSAERTMFVCFRSAMANNLFTSGLGWFSARVSKERLLFDVMIAAVCNSKLVTRLAQDREILDSKILMQAVWGKRWGGLSAAGRCRSVVNRVQSINYGFWP